MRPTTCLLSTLAATTLLATLHAQGPYTIRRLPGLGSLQHGRAQGVDAQGRVVGELLDAGGLEQPILWTAGVPQALPAHAGGGRGSGWAISSNGVLAGDAGSATTPHVATTWQPAGGGGFTPIDMGLAPGDIFSHIYAINGNGASCGYTDDGIVFRPCAWIVDADVGNPVLLPIPSGYFAGDAFAIDAGNQIVGAVATFGLEAPVAWRQVGGAWAATLLPTLGTGTGRAVDIDAAGVIAGSAPDPATGRDQVVTWTGGAITNLGGVPGQDCWTAASNDVGDLVGTIRTFQATPFVGFVRPAGGAITDLNSLLPAGSAWTIRRANDVNDAGVIVGEGALGGFVEPFAMIPVSMAHATWSPGISGQTNSTTVSGATPNQPVFFFVAATGGETVIPGCFEGLDLAAPLTITSVTANGAGVATLTLPVPAALAGVPLLYQAYDPAACHTTNVVPFTFL